MSERNPNRQLYLHVRTVSSHDQHQDYTDRFSVLVRLVKVHSADAVEVQIESEKKTIITDSDCFTEIDGTEFIK